MGTGTEKTVADDDLVSDARLQELLEAPETGE